MKHVLSLVRVAALLLLFLAANTASAFYNPTIGKWISRDPVGERGGANQTGFCHNEPTIYLDDLGGTPKTFAAPMISVAGTERKTPETPKAGSGKIKKGGGWNIYKYPRAYLSYSTYCCPPPEIKEAGGRYHLISSMVAELGKVDKNKCCINHLEISTHFNGIDLYVHDDTVGTSWQDFVKALPPMCKAARVVLNVCNGYSIAQSIAAQNSGVPNVTIEYVNGTCHNIPGTPLVFGGTDDVDEIRTDEERFDDD